MYNTRPSLSKSEVEARKDKECEKPSSADGDEQTLSTN